MFIAFLVLAGLTVFAFVCLAIFHPLVCVVQCLMSKGKSTTSKLVWIAVNLVTGIFGSLVYTFAASDSPKLKRVTANTFKGGLLSGVLAAGVFAVSPDVRERASLTGVPMAGALDSDVSFESFDAAMEDLEASMAELNKLSEEMGDLQADSTEFFGDEAAVDGGKLTSTESLDSQAFDASELLEEEDADFTGMQFNAPLESPTDPQAVAPALDVNEMQAEEAEESLAAAALDFFEGLVGSDVPESAPSPASTVPVEKAEPTSDSNSTASKSPQTPKSPEFTARKQQPKPVAESATQINRYTGKIVIFGDHKSSQTTPKSREPINRYLIEGNPAQGSTGAYPSY